MLKNLKMLGVDVKMARKRQPGVLKKAITNEHGLVSFLQTKGASREVVAGIITRFPRSITRSGEHLEERWQLWRSVFQSDSEIVSILNHSPESFFRSSDNDNLEKNIVFLGSLGLDSKDLHRLLTTAPRTSSNSPWTLCLSLSVSHSLSPSHTLSLCFSHSHSLSLTLSLRLSLSP